MVRMFCVASVALLAIPGSTLEAQDERAAAVIELNRALTENQIVRRDAT